MRHRPRGERGRGGAARRAGARACCSWATSGAVRAAAAGRGIARARARPRGGAGRGVAPAAGDASRSGSRGRDLARARSEGRARRPRASGAAQLAWIDAACDLVARGEADALVTGPVSKEAIAGAARRARAEFLGHTEHLARRLARARGGDGVLVAGARHVARDDAPPAPQVPARHHARAAVARATYWLAWLPAREPGEARAAHRGRRRSTRTPARAGCSGARRRRASRRASRARASGSRRRRRTSTRRIDGPVPAPRRAFRLARARGGWRRRRRDVPRPGDHPDEARRLRRGGERVARAAHRAHQRRPRHAYDRAGKGKADARGCARRSGWRLALARAARAAEPAIGSRDHVRAVPLPRASRSLAERGGRCEARRGPCS